MPPSSPILMPLRVGLITCGTRGDVQPFLALSQELRARGHEVAICCPACCVTLVHEHGIEAYGMTYDPKQAIQGPEMQNAIHHGDGAGCVRAINEAQQRQVRETGVDPADEVYDFVRGYQPQILVGHPSFVPLIAVAEAFALPLINALFMPFLPSRVVAPAWYTKAQLQESGLGTPMEAHKLFWDMYITEEILTNLNSLRLRWGLAPYESRAQVQAVYQSAPEANCWSREVFPEPSDLEQEFPLAKQTGYLYADAPADYHLPAGLSTFLLGGQKKPIYVGFGSLCVGDPRLATEKVLRALRRAGQRCIMAGGWAGISPAHLHASKTADFLALKELLAVRVRCCAGQLFLTLRGNL